MAVHQPTISYRNVPNYPGYRIGNDGSVWSLWIGGRKARIGEVWRQLKSMVNSDGRHRVCLTKGKGLRRRFQVHRLVLEAFVGPCPPGMECCHWDGNPSNNHLSNLRWDTQAANKEDQRRHGTLGRPAGEDSAVSRLTEELVREIMRLRMQEGLGCRRIVRRLGLEPVLRSAVHAVCIGRTWNHVTGLPFQKTHGRCCRGRESQDT